MVYVTGDIHSGEYLNKLSEGPFPGRKNMTKDDYVIIAGDFGVPLGGGYASWDRDNFEWLNAAPFTTLFVDGNHENFDLLEEYEEVEFKGGTARRLADSVFHLKRGEIYTLQGKRFFTFGGARSHDAIFRTEHINWWRQEEPDEQEYKRGLAALERCGWKVDFVITHAAPASLAPRQADAPVCLYLEQIRKRLEFEKWFFGHYHMDQEYEGGRFRQLFEDVVRVI